MPEDLYELLQVHPSADADVITAAYRRLVLKYHPDRNKSPEATEWTSRINLAHELLSDPVRRAEYDRQRASDKQETGAEDASGNSSQGGRSGPQTEASTSSQNVTDEDIYAGVAQRLSNGVRPDLIVDQLVRDGWPREEVHSFVWSIYEEMREANRRSRRTNPYPDSTSQPRQGVGIPVGLIFHGAVASDGDCCSSRL